MQRTPFASALRCCLLSIGVVAGDLGLPSDVNAGDDQWTDLQLPDGAFATAVAADPADGATVYVATAGGIVYKSSDGGATWSATDLHQFEDGGDVPPVLSALAIDPNDPDVVVAGADYGRIFRSRDAGASWERDRVGGGNQIIHGLELGLGGEEVALAPRRTACGSRARSRAATGSATRPGRSTARCR